MQLIDKKPQKTNKIIAPHKRNKSCEPSLGPCDAPAGARAGGDAAAAGPAGGGARNTRRQWRRWAAMVLVFYLQLSFPPLKKTPEENFSKLNWWQRPQDRRMI